MYFGSFLTQKKLRTAALNNPRPQNMHTKKGGGGDLVEVH